MTDVFQEYQRLRVRVGEDGVATLVLGSGDATNSVDARLHGELATVWDDLDRHPDVRAVVVRGPTTDGFLYGGSPELARELNTDSAARFRMLEEHRRFVFGMVNCSKPLVAAITGRAVGEGTVIGLMADISVVGPSTTLLDRHVPLGVVAGDHAALVWPLLTSLAKAKYYLLLGEELDGTEAERIGLVSCLVDDDAVLDKAHEVARRLADSPANAVRWTKHALNNWLKAAGPAFDASLALEVLGFADPAFGSALDAAAAAKPATGDPA